MSLRRRLVIVILAVVAAGLVGSDVATWSALQSFLIGRVDAQLDTGANQVARYAAAVARHGYPLRFRSLGARLSPDLFLIVLDARGRVAYRRPSSTGVSSDPAPQLPNPVPLVPGSRLASSREHRGAYHPEAASFGMRSRGPHPVSYRAEAKAFGGNVAVIASPLTQVNETLHSLLLIEVTVTAAILFLVLLFVLWVARLGLKPLREMTATAHAIAEGDLSRRIEVSSPATEVGSLGEALNTMIGQIAGALAEQRASEGRLRRFVADASHELRTPLASIRGYAELFRRGAGKDPADLERAMARIEQESARMGGLVDDLLLLARLDQGRPLERSPVDLSAVASRVVGDARAVEPEREIELAAPVPVVVIGDEHRLQQVAANLLANCRVHAGSGAVVHVDVHAIDGVARLSVADDGAGMDAEGARNAFDRFFRGRGNTHGSGLGLSIVAAIVRAHGGTPTLRSELGRGTTVTIDLPLADRGHPSSSLGPPLPEQPAGTR